MKALLKMLVRGLALLATTPLALLERLARSAGDEQLFAGLSQLLALFPGRLGSFLRVAFYRLSARSCGKENYIGFGTLFSQHWVELGERLYIGPQCNIGACTIGNDTLVASGVHIMSGTGQHNFDDLNTPIRDQGGHFKAISIGQDCWLGNGAIVMADVGDHAIVGAGAVVTKPVPAWAIAVGNPAQVVRYRNSTPSPSTSAAQTPEVG